MVISHWSLVIGHLSLVIGHWSFVIGHLFPPPFTELAMVKALAIHPRDETEFRQAQLPRCVQSSNFSCEC
ncbi:hypothetical protein [Coleofasciculus chthonoplastes]|uniref:hypothetical protein n=1 Tax=Coleofasciculus chthonoplastes TaxID=64178 RepID=UPI0032F63E9B